MIDRISVIIPVYNVEKYLERCVESILKQTYSNFKMLLIDDGSSDNSGNICDKYAALDERVFVIHQKNQGVAVARNVGIEWAHNVNCDWIAFIDSDDWVHERYLEKLLDAAKAFNTSISVCEYFTTDGRIIKCDEKNYKEKRNHGRLLY